jgi:simple sugar transport system permease protein
MYELLTSTLRLATPLIFAAMAGLLSERSGVIQIALEGFMLVGALAAAVATTLSGHPWLGLAAASAAGMVLSLIYAFFVLQVRADQIVTGTAVNLFAFGICPFITKILFDSTGSTPPIELENRLQSEFLFLALAVVVAVALLVRFSRFGLWIQFAGESPQALQSAGVSVQKVRWLCLAACGALAGWGGASLSISLASAYSPNMTAGRGFMALAALIFGRWRAGPAFAACLLFAFVDAVQIRMQGTSTWIPVSIVQILPYLVTIIALVGFFGHSRAPKGLGKHV